MIKSWFVGVDGGATKTIVRVEDAAGTLLAEAMSGPANIRFSPEQAWQSIRSALDNIAHTLHISLNDRELILHAGMGLAGTEIIEAYQAFVNHPHPFKTLVLSSDAYTACLGAHKGQDGAVIIMGTGAVGYQIHAGEVTKVSGFGFPHDDQGGGAWLGLEAVKLTLQWRDGRMPASALTQAVYAHFGNDENKLVTFAHHAEARAYAELAPLVVEQSSAGDRAAISLMQQAADAIDRIAAVFLATLPCALVGGLAPYIEPYLSQTVRARLRPCELTPAAGAILLARQALEKPHDR